MKNTQASLPSTELVLTCARAAIDKKANHSLIYEVGKLGAFTDYFLITSGASDRQVRAIADAIHRLGREKGMGHPKMEGFDEGRWVLIDFGSVVIHVFHDDIREFYDLESLWTDAPRLGIPAEYYASQGATSAASSSSSSSRA
ncbi:MAG: ribosome silencing factor [Deltaproteobacteria bacterium]|nr:ribosome silencing factor [Deltaproteobacteria bacterium]